MYLHALATAVPPTSFTQMECWGIAERSPVRSRLSRRSSLILHSILKGDHGIATRHFAVSDIDRVFDLSPDELNAAFRHHAPKLAGQALTDALAKAGVRPEEVDALLVCTCTGYLCPGLTSYISEQLGFRSNTFLQDLVGLGCGAAIPTLRAAQHVIAAQPGAVVACVAVEICSAAFYLDDDPVRFEQREGKLRNLLDRSVPELAAGAVGKLWAQRGDRPVSRVVAHPGGRDVLEALAPVFAPHALSASVATLRHFGNMSSPSVLFALEETLRTTKPDTTGDFWLVSFGAGFSAHSCRLARD